MNRNVTRLLIILGIVLTALGVTLPGFGWIILGGIATAAAVAVMYWGRHGMRELIVF
jgi:membrane-bound ClpP family serine protease